jgi:hypothetical protein
MFPRVPACATTQLYDPRNGSWPFDFL